MKLSLSILLFISIAFSNHVFSQVKIGLPIPGKDISSVTLVDDDGTQGYYIKKGGKRVDLPSTRLQINFGFNLINADKAIDGKKTTLDTRELEYLMYSGRVFIAIPNGKGKTDFAEIALFNKKYFIKIIREPSNIRFAVYNRATYKKECGDLSTNTGPFVCENESSGGKPVKGKQGNVRPARIKAYTKAITKLNLATYFPELSNLESEIIKEIENGDCLLSNYNYKNLGKAKDLYESWYK